MTDPSPEGEPPTPDGAAQEAEPREGTALGAEDPADGDRRAFLNQISHDAVWTAGRVAGFSAMIRRGLFAAGEAAASSVSGKPEINDQAVGGPGEEDSPPSASPTTPTPPPPTPAPDAIPPSPPTPAAVPRDPVRALTEEQRALLATMNRAVLAVNDPSGGPHVTTSRYHWDGAVFHLPARQSTLRATNVERDPRVSLFIQDPASGAAVAIGGLATMVYGERVAALMEPILIEEVGAEGAARRWQELEASADRAMIEVIPNRFVWHTA